MSFTEEERESIIDKLDSYGERHFFYNEEYHPECLENLNEREIVITCNTRIKKAMWYVKRRYNRWRESNDSKEDSRVYRSMLEQEITAQCDTPMYSCFEEDWYINEYTPSEDDYPDNVE